MIFFAIFTKTRSILDKHCVFDLVSFSPIVDENDFFTICQPNRFRSYSVLSLLPRNFIGSPYDFFSFVVCFVS